jgi:two-component system, NarL family, response regulator
MTEAIVNVNETSITVLLAQSEYLNSLDFKSKLSALPHIDAISHLDEKQDIAAISDLRSHIVLFDLDRVGVTALSEFIEQDKSIHVLAFASHLICRHFNRLIEAGVRGYCIKDPEPQRLHTAISTVSRGDVWIDGQVSGALSLAAATAGEVAYVDRVSHESFSTVHSEVRSDNELSIRERQILQMIMTGAANHEIAATLFLSVATVKTVVRRILYKLNVTDRTQAAVYAATHRIV